MQTNRRVEATFWDLHISEGRAETGAIPGVKDLALRNQETTPDDVLLLEALAELLAIFTGAGLLGIREDPCIRLVTIGSFLVPQDLGSLLICRAETNDNISLVLSHTKYFDLKVKDEALIFE